MIRNARRGHVLGGISFLFLGLLCTPLVAQTPADAPAIIFDDVTLESGRFEELVFCTYKDRLGFMWFGTSRGLVRYDSYQMRWYRPDPDDDHALSGASVYAIHEDGEGRFWIGTNLGLNLMDRRTGRFERYRHSPDDPSSLCSDIVKDINHDARGHVWICTTQGVNRFVAGRLERIDAPAGRRMDGDGKVAVDRKGIVFVAFSNGGLFRCVDKGALKPVEGLDGVRVNALCPSLDGALWVGTNAGILVIEDGRHRWIANRPGESMPLTDNQVTDLAQGPLGSIWIATNQGLTRIMPNGTFQRVHHQPGEGHLGSDRILDLYCDSDEILWVATLETGIQYFDLHRERFRFSPTEACALLEDAHHRVYIGNHTGLGLWDGPANGIRPVLEDHDVRSLMSWQDGLLVGTIKGLLFYREGQPLGQLGEGKRFWKLAPKKGGQAWVGTSSGLYVLEADGRLRPRTEGGSGAARLDTSVITAIVPEEGGLWVATYGNGLYFLDLRADRSMRYAYDPNNPGSLSADDILDLLRDRQGQLWVGTLSGGLNLLGADRRQFRRFTVKEGFPDMGVAALLEDRDGLVWANTGVGLVKILPGYADWLTYRSRDGVQIGGAGPGAMLQARDNRIFVGGSGGLVTFQPRELEVAEAPKLVFTAVRIDDREVSHLLLPGETVAISNRHKTFTFDFSLLDFRSPGFQRVAYRREGLDDSWIVPSTGRSVNYTRHLSFGGVSKLSVRGSNNNGVMAQAEISVAIKKPVWVKLLPITLPLGLGLLIGAIYLGISLRERQRRRQLIAEARLAREQRMIAEQRARIAEREREMEYEERRLQEERSLILQKHLEQVSTELANELHDGPLGDLHGLGFRLNELGVALDAEPELQTVIQTCTHEVLPRVCSQLRNICGDLLSPDFVCGLDAELDGYMDMVEEREKLTIHRNLDSDRAGLDQHQMATFYRICRTLLKNVARHADARQVRVDFRAEMGLILLQIEDDGRGFEVPEDWDAFKRAGHYGMYMANYFAASIGGTFQVDAKPGEGTKVTVTAPLRERESEDANEADSNRHSRGRVLHP